MRKFDSINVIPFIDIMLVLLAIVLTTATFVASGQLDISLPSSESESRTQSQQPVEIAIDRDLQYFFNGEASDLERIEQQLRAGDSTTPVVLVIDATVPFDKFVSVIDLLKDRPTDTISIRTRKGS